MEIHYLWIYDSGYLKTTGINLSSRFIIDLQIEPTRSAGNVMTISFNADYIENFFEKKNITNVTALIGKNGAGKSSVLDYIKSHLPEGLEATITNDIFVYSIKNGDTEQFSVIFPRQFQIALIDKTGLFSIHQYDDYPEPETFRDIAQLSHADYIYYSFFFDFKSQVDNWGGLRNISTAALIQAERRTIFEENTDEQVRRQKLEFASDMDYFIVSEIQRAIQFIISDEGGLILFEKPENLWITINDTDGLYFNKRNKSDQDIYLFLEELQKHTKHSTATEDVLNKLMIALFVNFLLTERKFSGGVFARHQLRISEDETIRSFIVKFFENLADTKVTVSNGEHISSKYETLSKIVPQFIEYVERLLNENALIPDFNRNNAYLIFPLNKASEQELKTFMNYYLAIKGITTFLDFGWRGLSTGEQSYLSFMSRFHHIKHHEHGTLKKNLVIMIDEGDAGYHPEWQRTFFNTSLNFLSRLYKDHTLQLIFTANTPFISSDLPKSNVLFIEKRGRSHSEFHGKLNNREQTFGANIHTLFSNSFYMEHALIGQFAYDKIDKIIKFLGDKDVTVPDATHRKVINLIGESILRKKLLDMWNRKFGLSEELEALRLRIVEIEKIQREKP